MTPMRLRGTRRAVLVAVMLSGCTQRAQLPPPRLPLVVTARSDFPPAPRVASLAPPAQLPEVETLTLANGLRVLVVNRPGDDQTFVRYLARAGAEDRGLADLGLSTLAVRASLHAALARRTRAGGPSTLAEKTAHSHALAAETPLSAWAERSAAYVQTEVAPEALDATLGELAELMFGEAPSSDAVAVAVREQFDAMDDNVYDQDGLARLHAAQMLFGDAHPRGHAVEGLPRNLERFTLGDVDRQREAIFAPETSALVLVGPVTRAQVARLVARHFAAAPRASHALPEPVLGARVTQTRCARTLLTPGRIAHIVEAFPAPPLAAPDAVPFMLLSLAAGELYAGRLNQALREQLMHTYGAQASYQPLAGEGSWTIETEVAKGAVAPALTAIDAELARLRSTPITEGELARAKLQARERLLSRLESRAETAALLTELVTAWPDDAVDVRALLADRLARIARTQAAELTAVAGRYLTEARRGLVISGPFQAYQTELEQWCGGDVAYFVPERLKRKLER